MRKVNKTKKTVKISELVDKEGNLLGDSTPDYIDDVVTADNITTDEFVDATRQKDLSIGNYNRNNFSFGSIFEIVDEVVSKVLSENKR